MSASVPSKPQLLDSPLDRLLGPRTAKKIASLGLETGVIFAHVLPAALRALGQANSSRSDS